ncbi:hypothetical protein KIPB_011673, partial [Kipferlia bialata]|eukprot:g11673.t1
MHLPSFPRDAGQPLTERERGLEQDMTRYAQAALSEAADKVAQSASVAQASVATHVTREKESTQAWERERETLLARIEHLGEEMREKEHALLQATKTSIATISTAVDGEKESLESELKRVSTELGRVKGDLSYQKRERAEAEDRERRLRQSNAALRDRALEMESAEASASERVKLMEAEVAEVMQSMAPD